MKFKECLISWCWSHTLLIIFVGITALQTLVLVKKQKNQICSYNNLIMLPKINLEHLELLRP